MLEEYDYELHTKPPKLQGFVDCLCELHPNEEKEEAFDAEILDLFRIDKASIPP